jgi:hypothetical protein
MTEHVPFRPLAPALLRGWGWSQRLRDKTGPMPWLGESGQIVLAGGSKQNLLFQPNGVQLSALFGCVGARGLRFGAENEVCWIRLGERVGVGSSTSAMQGTWPGARPEPEVFLTPIPLLPLPHRPSAPPLHYSIPLEIPCNLSRRFPLYGVEAGGLPAKAAQRKELIVNKD